VVIDASGHVVAVGPRLASLAGHSPQHVGALVGLPVAQLLRGAALSGPLGHTLPLEVRAGERPPTSGNGVRTSDGEHTRITFLPEAAAHGAARGSANDAATRALVGEMHDALTAIAGFAAMTQLAPTPHRRRYHADHITAQVERLRRLGQALDPGYYARHPIVAPADLAVEVPNALRGLRIPLERHGVAFEVQCGDGALWAACDARLIGDLVSQLIVRATLAQRHEFQANEVDVTVLPTSADRIAITLRFADADEPQLLMHDGVGLGDDPGGATLPPGEVALRWAHLALERQGGTFLRKVERAADEVVLTLSLPKAEAPRLLDQTCTPVALDVLVIDDDAVLGELYVELLAISGHTVTPCRTLLAAREALASRHFDVVLAEFQLRDGLLSELWAESREILPVLAHRLLVVTRDPRDARLIDWASRSLAPIVAKPCSPPALIDRIALIASRA
jgi:CheY-like chemotaxis protein